MLLTRDLLAIYIAIVGRSLTPLAKAVFFASAEVPALSEYSSKVPFTAGDYEYARTGVLPMDTYLMAARRESGETRPP